VRATAVAAAAAAAATAGTTTRGVSVSLAQQPDVTACKHALGIVFFAGHGLQVSGVNYLVPADFRVPDAGPINWRLC
jgi:hypothetical protein